MSAYTWERWHALRPDDRDRLYSLAADRASYRRLVAFTDPARSGWIVCGPRDRATMARILRDRIRYTRRMLRQSGVPIPSTRATRDLIAPPNGGTNA